MTAPSLLNIWKSLLYVEAYRSPSSSMPGNRTGGISISRSPIIAAHSSSVRDGSLSSLIVACVVRMMTAAVSANDPSKSKMRIFISYICLDVNLVYLSANLRISLDYFLSLSD